ncbi:MAG TPA: RpiB/LacA/LacB family sugar-phosphate isomerase [Candidatus Paceibacterota bacterium]|jgi:ribose 5-phosphate isomerase B|nr:RpiB/LacA/LacB family sugar-phosphate isomerase [Candidatus Paceibacterota bacterium]
MKIYFGSDHAGFEIKRALIPFVQVLGHQAEDLGDFEPDPQDDYTDFVIPVARLVAHDPDNTRGIVIGGSGQGEAMAANRFHDVRAVVFNGQYAPGDGRKMPNEIELSRMHNNSNVLSLGARFITEEVAKDAVKLWLATPFSNDERHVRRLRKMEEMTR